MSDDDDVYAVIDPVAMLGAIGSGELEEGAELVAATILLDVLRRSDPPPELAELVAVWGPEDLIAWARHYHREHDLMVAMVRRRNDTS